MEWRLPQPKSTKTTETTQRQGERTYVLDTSVLLSDPKSIFRFAEHSVVLPVVVVSELEAKRNDPEIGYFARQALRMLDELRVQAGRLDQPVPIGDAGGTIRVQREPDVVRLVSCAVLTTSAWVSARPGAGRPGPWPRTRDRPRPR
jgi:hypothetical protein